MEDIRARAGALSLKYQDAPLAGIADQPQRLCDFHLQPSWSEPTKSFDFGRRLSNFHDDIGTDKSLIGSNQIMSE